MPSSTVRAFTDPDVYHAAIRDANTEGMIMGRGAFRAEWTTIGLDRLSLQSSAETLPRVSYSVIDPKVFGIVFTTSPGSPVHVHGVEASYGDIVVYRAGAIGHDRSSMACQWGAIALTHEDLAAAAQSITAHELTAPP